MHGEADSDRRDAPVSTTGRKLMDQLASSRLYRRIEQYMPPAEQRAEMLRFGVVGIANTLLDFGLFALLHYAAGVEPVIANTASYSTAVVSAFLCHRYWTFSQTGTHRRAHLQFAVFFGCNGIGLLLSNLTVWALAPLVSAAGAKLVSLGVTYCWNYWSSRRFVFTPPSVARDIKTS